MKAIVKYGQSDGEVEIRDVPIPEIGPGEVLLKVEAAGICGWDIEMWRHKMANPVKVPVIQGHEFAGTICKMENNVGAFEIGDRVVSETAAYICGVCPQCRSGNYNMCAERKGFGYGMDGAFTDYVCVPERCLHKIPDNISFDHASLTEPACVAYNAVFVQSRIMPGQSVVIIGPGPVGLFCLQMAKIGGAGKIIMVGTDRDSTRFDTAAKLGADIIINVNKDDTRGIISGETCGQGAHLVIDAAGNAAALDLAMDSVVRCGQITKIGWGPKPVNLSLDRIISKSVRLQGAFSHTWSTWEAVLKLIEKGLLDMESMVSRRTKIEQWKNAYEEIEDCKSIKTVFIFD